MAERALTGAWLELRAHPRETPPPVRLKAMARRLADGGLLALFRLTGDLDRLRLPAAGMTRRADTLWRHSCFEVFVAGKDRYHEFNLAPSRAWAAYAFGAYRQPLSDWRPAREPRARIRRLPCALCVRLHCTASVLPPPATNGWRLNLATVLENQAGELTHWAPCHLESRPDFHDLAAYRHI